VTKQPDTIKSAEEAGALLGQRLREGHDRAAATARMQKRIMSMFGETA
jgi:hypothetical protein